MSKGGIAEALAHDKKTSEKGSVVRIHDFAPDLAKVADALRHEFTDIEIVNHKEECPGAYGRKAMISRQYCFDVHHTVGLDRKSFTDLVIVGKKGWTKINCEGKSILNTVKEKLLTLMKIRKKPTVKVDKREAFGKIVMVKTKAARKIVKACPIANLNAII